MKESIGWFVRLGMTRERPLLSKIPSDVLGYGLAVLSVAIALGIALYLDSYQFRGLITPFLFAIAVSAWFGGVRAAALPMRAIQPPPFPMAPHMHPSSQRGIGWG
jgi:hypothetical protein